MTVVEAPAVTVAGHDSQLGCWQFVTRAPAAGLRPFVRRYTGYVERTNAPLRRIELPGVRIVVVISFGPELRLHDPARALRPAERHTSFVAGLSRTRVITEHGGDQHGIQFDLEPLAARMLLGVPMRELTDRAVALDDLLGHAASGLVERLAEASSWDARFALLDGALADRLADALPPRPELARVWARLLDTDGRVEIEALAHEVGWSRRHLAARFGDEVGLPPKTVARLLRFERARSLLVNGDGARLAEIAYACGYFDQAHLNRDFREFAGIAPGELLARRLPDGGGIDGG